MSEHTGLIDTTEEDMKQFRNPVLFQSSGAMKLVVKKLTVDMQYYLFIYYSMYVYAIIIKYLYEWV